MKKSKTKKLPSLLDFCDGDVLTIYREFANYYDCPCFGDWDSMRKDPRDPVQDEAAYINACLTNLALIKMIEVLNNLEVQMRERFLAKGQTFSSDPLDNMIGEKIRKKLSDVFNILDAIH